LLDASGRLAVEAKSLGFPVKGQHSFVPCGIPSKPAGYFQENVEPLGMIQAVSASADAPSMGCYLHRTTVTGGCKVEKLIAEGSCRILCCFSRQPCHLIPTYGDQATHDSTARLSELQARTKQ
jgi:hypothetical protein